MKRSVRWVILGILTASTLVLSLSTPAAAQIGVGISVRIGPPALPVYAQPICPGPGYLWTPGYWAWNDDGGYYWVPGTWVVAPVGMLWTPGYWGWGGGFYRWHGGYWGPHVGFYGGINYGFGYGGVGFFGGEWRGGAFFYNRSVVNVNVRNVTNVYNRTVVVNNTRTVSFNGPGGIEARPTREEEEYSHESHTQALSAQTEHEHMASQNRQNFASENHGRPAVAATARPGEFSGHGVVKAKAAGEPYHAPKMSTQEARVNSENRGGNSNNREMGRSENNKAKNNNNEARNNGHNNNEMRNSQQENRSQMSSHNSPKPTKQEQKQQRQVQKQAQTEQKRADRARQQQAKAEQKRNAHEGHR